MIPIQDILHRIQWDPACRGGLFEIGYIDRVAGTIVRVPFEPLQLQGGTRAALTVHDAGGTARRIPLHRVRRVWRDGVVIWERHSGNAQEFTNGCDAHG